MGSGRAASERLERAVRDARTTARCSSQLRRQRQPRDARGVRRWHDALGGRRGARRLSRRHERQALRLRRGVQSRRPPALEATRLARRARLTGNTGTEALRTSSSRSRSRSVGRTVQQREQQTALRVGATASHCGSRGPDDRRLRRLVSRRVVREPLVRSDARRRPQRAAPEGMGGSLTVLSLFDKIYSTDSKDILVRIIKVLVYKYSA